MISIHRTLALLLAAGFIAGCGLKGDLYLEEPEEEAPPAMPQAEPLGEEEIPAPEQPEEQLEAQPGEQVEPTAAEAEAAEQPDATADSDAAAAEDIPQDAATPAP